MDFHPYGHSILESLYKHGKIPHEEHDPFSSNPQGEKGCRHKLKAHQKAQAKACHDQNSPVGIASEEGTHPDVADERQERKKERKRVHYPSLLDSAYQDRPPVTGVYYDTARNRWKATCMIYGELRQAYFSVGRYGAESAYQRAVDWRKKMEKEGAPLRYPFMPDPVYRSRPPVTGVSYDTHQHRWMASCIIHGECRRAYFPVGQYGAEPAYQSAVAWRKKMEQEGASVRAPAKEKKKKPSLP